MPDFTQEAQAAQGVQPVDYRPGANGQQVPVYNNATPGFSGAILDAVRALAMALAPKSVTQAIPRNKQNQAVAEGSMSPHTTDLGNQFN